jgi:FkbM family methyltransferase
MYDDALIYDVGAHTGEDTDFYLKKGFRVVAVEANPELAQALEKKFSDAVRCGKLTIANVAIAAGSGGEVDFYVDSAASVWGTTNKDWVERNKSLGAGNVTTIRVPTVSLSDLMKEYGVPRYCKIDIEGNDLIALRSLKELDVRPNFVSIESEKRSWSRLIDEMDTFSSLGYSKFNIVDQTLVIKHKCPTPPRELNYVDCAFLFGSSGLFGDELPGRWMDYSDAIQRYKQIFTGYALNGDNGLFTRRSGILNLIRAFDRALDTIRGRKAVEDPKNTLPATGWYDTHAAR